MKSILKLKSTYAELGFANTLLYIIDKALVKLTFHCCSIHKYYITCQPVSDIPGVPETKGLDIDVKPLPYDDSALLCMDRPLAVLRARNLQGGQCFAAFKKGQFAGNLWLNFDRYKEDEVRCEYILLPLGSSAWDYDVFVLERFRFSYVFAKLWDVANEVMSKRNVRYVYSRINYYNIRSLQSHKRLGSRIAGTAYFLKVGSGQLMLSRHFRPYVHFSVRKNDYPALYIENNQRTMQPE